MTFCVSLVGPLLRTNAEPDGQTGPLMTTMPFDSVPSRGADLRLRTEIRMTREHVR